MPASGAHKSKEPRKSNPGRTKSNPGRTKSTNEPRRLMTWTRDNLHSNIPSVTKSNFTLLASYNSNFLPRGNLPVGSIVVPGYPPEWDPPPLPISLRPDSDLNLPELTPSRNLEPLFLALATSQPTFDLNQIDIITDRNNLRKLLNFASGKSHQPFWICIEIINNTALFTTLEPHGRKCLQQGQNHIYGHQFEGAFTKSPEEVKGTTQHMHGRMVSYGFGGLQLLVRFEADGTLPENIESFTGLDGQETKTLESKSSSNHMMGSNPKQPDGVPSHTPKKASLRPGKGLEIVQGGELVAQERIIELKTRANNRRSIQECMPQLWFSGTQHLYIGFHQKGTFTSVTKYHIDENTFSTWENAHKTDLSKLADLLHKIVETAKGVSGRTCVKCVRGNLILDEWHETRSTPVQKLPQYLRLFWQPAQQPGIALALIEGNDQLKKKRRRKSKKPTNTSTSMENA